MEMKMKNRLVGAVMIAAVGAGLLGCATDPYRSSGRVQDDRTVNSRVKDALKGSQVYKFPYVDVITYNGMVQLNGFVHTDEQKGVATELSRNIPGVREVMNNITIVPTEPAYGGTVDPKTGVRGSGSGSGSTTNATTYPRNPNE